MKAKLLFLPLTVASMSASAHAAATTYQLASAAILVNSWGGADGLIGSLDDVIAPVDTEGVISETNATGSMSHVSFDFEIPGGDSKLATTYDAVSFLAGGSFVFDPAAGPGSPLVQSFSLTGGTQPFPGHGPFTAATTGSILGTSGVGTFAVSAAPYDATLMGGPATATMNFAGTYDVVDATGPAPADPYLSFVHGEAVSQGASSFVVLTGVGSSGADTGATGPQFLDMPIQVTLVGFETAPVPEPSSSMLLVGACSLFLLRRRK